MASKKESKEEQKHSKEVLRRFQGRLSYLKNAKEYFRVNDFVNATKNYTAYIQIVAEYKRVDEKKLRPEHFDLEKEAAECLLLSHCFFDLAKIYDRTPRLKTEFERVLNQYVLFTQNFKYQGPNTRMLKRFIKKKKLVNRSQFDFALKQLGGDKSECYIVTFCYSSNHPVCEGLRSWRDQNQKRFFLRTIFNLYEWLSPPLVLFLSKRNKLAKASAFIFRPIIGLFYQITLPRIKS